MLGHGRQRGKDDKGMLDEPPHVVVGFMLRSLERIGSQVELPSSQFTEAPPLSAGGNR
jgi:hypothetical protein